MERNIGLGGRGRTPAGRSQCGECAGPREAGFSLTELLIAFVILAIAMMIGIPAIQNLIVRSKTEGFARTASGLMQRTRLESIKKNRTGAVYLDEANRRLVAFINADGDEDLEYDPSNGTTPATTDYQIGWLDLPSDVEFKEPGGATGAASVDRFDLTPVTIGTDEPPAAVFRPDGSIAQDGAFRIGDLRENWLEIRVEPAATARIEILKYNEATGEFQAAGDVTADDYEPWEWK